MGNDKHIDHHSCFLLTLANLEADQIYSFVRQLPKKAEAYLNREYELECQVNHHKAPVSWYKGDKKIEADNEMFVIVKDLTGLCRLTFKGPIKEDDGNYTCQIDKQNLKTTCHLKFVGEPLSINHSRLRSTAFYLRVHIIF